jgi:hypothetical protein
MGTEQRIRLVYLLNQARSGAPQATREIIPTSRMIHIRSGQIKRLARRLDKSMSACRAHDQAYENHSTWRSRS